MDSHRHSAGQLASTRKNAKDIEREISDAHIVDAQAFVLEGSPSQSLGGNLQHALSMQPHWKNVVRLTGSNSLHKTEANTKTTQTLQTKLVPRKMQDLLQDRTMLLPTIAKHQLHSVTSKCTAIFGKCSEQSITVIAKHTLKLDRPS